MEKFEKSNRIIYMYIALYSKKKKKGVCFLRNNVIQKMQKDRLWAESNVSKQVNSRRTSAMC